MSMGQLLLVILSVVLFSTLIISVYNSMANQMTMALQTTYENQAVYVANAVFEKIDSEYTTARQRTFANLSTFHNTTQDPVVIQGVQYTPRLRVTTVNANSIIMNCSIVVAHPEGTFTIGFDTNNESFNRPFNSF